MFVHATKIKLLASNNQEPSISRSFGKVIDTNGNMELKISTIDETNNIKNKMNKTLFRKALKKGHKPSHSVLDQSSQATNILITNPSLLQFKKRKAVSHLDVKTEGCDEFQIDDVSSRSRAITSYNRKLVNGIKNNDKKKSVKENNNQFTNINMGMISSINDQLNITDQNIIVRKGDKSLSSTEKQNLKKLNNPLLVSNNIKMNNFDKFLVIKDCLSKNSHKKFKEMIEDVDVIPHSNNIEDMRHDENDYRRFLIGDKKNDDFITRFLQPTKAKTAKSTIAESSEISTRESPNVTLGINLIDKIKRSTFVSLEALRKNKNVKRTLISNGIIIPDARKLYSNRRSMDQKNETVNLKGNLESIKEDILSKEISNNSNKASLEITQITRTSSERNEKNNKNFSNVVKNNKKIIEHRTTNSEIPINQLMLFNHNHNHGILYPQSIKYSYNFHGFSRIKTEPIERSDKFDDHVACLNHLKDDLKGYGFINLENSLVVEPINSSFHLPLQNNLMKVSSKTTKTWGENDVLDQNGKENSSLKKRPNIRIRPSSSKKLNNQNNIIMPKMDHDITPHQKRKSPDRKGKIREKLLYDMMETKLDGWISDGDEFNLF